MDLFRIDLADEFYEAFVALRSGHQERVRRLLEHLQVAPREVYPGVKRLRGMQSHLYQFMVSQSDGMRLLFSVDDDERVVRIEYLGKHPSWSRARDRQTPENY